MFDIFMITRSRNYNITDVIYSNIRQQLNPKVQPSIHSFIL